MIYVQEHSEMGQQLHIADQTCILHQLEIGQLPHGCVPSLKFDKCSQVLAPSYRKQCSFWLVIAAAWQASNANNTLINFSIFYHQLLSAAFNVSTITARVELCCLLYSPEESWGKRQRFGPPGEFEMTSSAAEVEFNGTCCEDSIRFSKNHLALLELLLSYTP